MNRNPHRSSRSAGRQPGFTLTEILIVVVILAILAMIVLPRFADASQAAKGNLLADHLRLIRSQIAVFRGQHLEIPPGYPGCDLTAGPTFEAFRTQMTLSSDADGNLAPVGTPGFSYGPYIPWVPPNPINTLDTVEIIGDGEEFPSEPDDSDGYIYQPSTLTFKPDCVGTDENNKSFFDY